MFGQDWAKECLTESGAATLRCVPYVISNVIVFALIASGITAAIFIIYAGFRYVTSSGDQKRIDSARKTLIWAIVGLVIILLAFAIVNFVGVLTGTENCINEIGFDNEGCQ